MQSVVGVVEAAEDGDFDGADHGAGGDGAGANEVCRLHSLACCSEQERYTCNKYKQSVGRS